MSLRCTFIDHGTGGAPDCLRLAERDMAAPSGRQVLIEVAYAGLEVAGTVTAVGPDVTQWRVGDPVCALTPGGGYAQYCLADERHCLPVPRGLDLLSAAAIPENYFTVWTNVFERARLAAGEKFLVHGGSSGIGLTAIQLARAFGAEVWTTVGNREKAEACLKAGAHHALIYRDTDFETEIRQATGGQGVDVILDMVGGAYINKNIRLLAVNGRLVQIAFLEGSKAEIDALPIMTKRLSFTGSTLRPRSDEDKGAIARALADKVLPLMEQGSCRPLIHAVFPLEQAAQAHALMESSKHIGKIMLKVRA